MVLIADTIQDLRIYKMNTIGQKSCLRINIKIKTKLMVVIGQT